MSQILLCYIPLFLICLRVRRPRFFQDPNTVSTGYFFKHFFGFCFFFWGGNPVTQGLVLALLSEITPVGSGDHLGPSVLDWLHAK